MMNQLAPSILSADFANLGSDIKKIDRAGAQYIHIDVMDGKFVPNISFAFPIIKAIRPLTDRIFDVHLMIDDPDRYIGEFAKAGADMICVHAEACRHLNRTIDLIKEYGKKAAVALNPATSLSVLDYVLEDLDMVLIMTVNPGFGGQSFIPNSIQKIQDLKKKIKERGIQGLDIEVDGGITLENVEQIKEAGANIFVAGSAVFQGDCEKNVEKFLEILSK